MAIIPARGGSKRIPKKNIKNFLGKPVIAYSIETALNSKLFDVVMVSTDDVEIAEVARKYGAEVPFMRDQSTSNDFATLGDVVYEVLNTYKGKGLEFDEVCCILATAPFVSSTLLLDSHKELMNSTFDTVFPVQKFGHPILRSYEMGEDKALMLNWPVHQNTRSQDLKSAFHDAGLLYWSRVSSLLRDKGYNLENVGGIEVGTYDTIDIDNESDWDFAEKLAKIKGL